MTTLYQYRSYNDPIIPSNTGRGLSSTTALADWNSKLVAGAKLESLVARSTLKSSFLTPDNIFTVNTSGGTIVYKNFKLLPDNSATISGYTVTSLSDSVTGGASWDVIGNLTVSPTYAVTGTMSSVKYSSGINTSNPLSWSFLGSVNQTLNGIQGSADKVVYTGISNNIFPFTTTYNLVNAYVGYDYVNASPVLSTSTSIAGYNSYQIDSTGRTVSESRYEVVLSVSANTNNIIGSILAGNDRIVLSGDANRENAAGWGGNDTIVGDAGKNYFNEMVDSFGYTAGLGNDTIDGGGNYDYVMYGSNKSISAYGFSKFSAGTNAITVNDYSALSNSGIDTLINIEEIQFSDKTLTFTELSTLMSRAESLGPSFGVLRVGSPKPDGLVGTDLNDLIYGNEGDDLISAGNGNDTIVGGTGSDLIDGGAGIDTVIYLGGKLSYKVTKTTSGITISSTSDGLDTLLGIERIRFPDGATAWDVALNQPSGQTALLLGAVLPGKLALDASKQALLGSVIGLFDSGFTMADLSGALLRLDIWSILTGQSVKPASRTLAEDTAIVKYLLGNVYGLVPDDVTVRANADVMHSEAFQGAWLAQLALSNAGQNHIGLVGLANTGIAYG